MKKSRGGVLIALLIFILSVLILSPTWSLPSAQAAEKQEKVSLELWAGRFGGTTYKVLYAVADVVNKHHPWIRIKAVETKGGWQNIRDTWADAEKRPHRLFSGADNQYYCAVRGLKPLTQKYPNYRVIGRMNFTGCFFVSTDRKITTVKDLVGKKIAIGPKGTGMPATAKKALYDIWKLKGKIKEIYLPTEEGVRAVLDGTVDVAAFTSPHKVPPMPGAKMTELLASKRSIFFINMTEKEYKAGVATAPDPGYYEYSSQFTRVPADCYFKGQPAFGMTTLSTSMLSAWTETDEKIVYEIIKTIWDNIELFPAYGAYTQAINRDMIWTVPGPDSGIHPGAMRFYKEKGVRGK